MARIKLSKEDCEVFYTKTVQLHENAEQNFFRLKKLRGVMGYCQWEDGIIIDYRKELIPTLIHECVHYLEPDWSESQVLYAEKRIINNLELPQIINILKLFLVCVS